MRRRWMAGAVAAAAMGLMLGMVPSAASADPLQLPPRTMPYGMFAPVDQTGPALTVPAARLAAGGGEPLVLFDVGLGAGSNAIAAWRLAEPAILTIVAADLVGAGEWQLQTTAEYARTRVQFDRPIGAFQAVKHPLVDMMLRIDEARSLVYDAACAFEHEPAMAETCARMAKAAASDAAAYASSRSVQLHGGIGFTWDCFVQIYFKRQKHNEVLYGDGGHQRARLAELLIGPIGAGA